MKKFLLTIILLGASVGGYFVVNLDWATILQQTKPLTEQEARALLKEKIGGNISKLQYHQTETPYYTATIEINEEIITLEIDAISKRISLKQAQAIDTEAIEDETTNATSDSATVEASDNQQPEQPQLPLTKEGAIQLAQQQFEGEMTDIILIERNNVRFYQIKLQSKTEQATIEFNQQTGELITNEVTELQGKKLDTVANALTKSNQENKTTQPTTKPSVNKIEAPTIKKITLDEAKDIAKQKIDGNIKSGKLNDQNLYEIKIIKGDTTHTLKIHPSTGLIIESTVE